MFSIVEANPFKQLTHLSLRFVPGDDATTKAYLAARLAQVEATRRSLSIALKQTSEELHGTQTTAAKLQHQLSTVSVEAESRLSQEKMKFADALDAQRREAASTLKERESELNAKIDALVERYEKEIWGGCVFLRCVGSRLITVCVPIAPRPEDNSGDK